MAKDLRETERWELRHYAAAPAPDDPIEMFLTFTPQEANMSSEYLNTAKDFETSEGFGASREMATANLEHEVTIGDGPLTVKIVGTRRGKPAGVDVAISNVAMDPAGVFTETHDAGSATFTDAGQTGSTTVTIAAGYTNHQGQPATLDRTFILTAVHPDPDALDISFVDPAPPPGPTPPAGT